MELNRIRELQAAFDAEHESAVRWDRPAADGTTKVLEHLVVCLVGEVGEFANVLKKVVRGDRSYVEARAVLTEELTDAFIYLIKICNLMDVDLDHAFLDRLAFNRERFKKFER